MMEGMEENGISSGERTRTLPPALTQAHPRLSTILSCSVCYDIITDPVLTKCSHSFCSICIRRYLLYKLQCPACFNELHEGDLVPNKPLRETLLSLLRDAQEMIPNKDPCNTCGISILRSKFEAHTLSCGSSSPRGSGGSKGPSKTLKPISKPVYHLLKDSDLKKRLKEEGLSVKGDRKTLISRHQRFSVLWNTEITKESPKSRVELTALLMKEEEALVSSQSEISVLSRFDRNSDPQVIEANQRDILKANKSSFTELIASVKAQKDRIIPPDAQNVKPVIDQRSPPEHSSPARSGVKNGELYITPKRKVLSPQPDSGKKMKQNSVRSLFERTERRKVNCPSCNALITPSFLNVHLDRCLEMEGRRSGRAQGSPDEDEDFMPLSQASTSRAGRLKK